MSPTESDLTDVGDEDGSSWSSSEKTSDNSFLEGLTIVLKVRSVPGPVTRLNVRLSTILGVLMWEFSSNNSGGYPIRSFTAEFRKFINVDVDVNETAQLWHRLDPENIPSNVVGIVCCRSKPKKCQNLQFLPIFSVIMSYIIWNRIQHTNFVCGPIIFWAPVKLLPRPQLHLELWAMRVRDNLMKIFK